MEKKYNEIIKYIFQRKYTTQYMYIVSKLIEKLNIVEVKINRFQIYNFEQQCIYNFFAIIFKFKCDVWFVGTCM